MALVSCVTDIGLAKDQRIANVGDALLLAQELEVPGAVGGVAIDAGAHQLVVAHHELAIDATQRIGERDLLAGVAAHEIAGGKEIDAGDLELGGRDRSRVAPDSVFGQVIGADLGLLEERRHQPVHGAPVVDAFADRVDERIKRLHRVVDHDAARAVDASRFGKRRIGFDAGRHHHQVGIDFLPVLEPDARHAAAVGVG